MVVSSNAIFHYTKKFEDLKSILKIGLRPGFCEYDYDLDMVTDEEERHSMYKLPMISFCDIPISRIQNHKKIYGEYAIGFTRKWAIKNGLEPIHYYHFGSRNYIGLGAIHLNLIDELKPDESIDCQPPFRPLTPRLIALNCLWYSKPYDGYSFKAKKNIVFYDEREWRYIPLPDELNDDNRTLFGLKRPKPKEHEIEKFQKDNILKFEAEDVEFIIVKKESMVPGLVDYINKNKIGKKEGDINPLLTRIISLEQIERNF